MPDGNGNGTGNGSSGNTGNETDWGAVINDVGGLVDDLFDGDFWTFLGGLGCLSSNFKLSYLKDRFPAQINKMRQLSGVDTALTNQNVNHFLKRINHIYQFLEAFKNGSSCKQKYFQKHFEMMTIYKTELIALLKQSGFVFKRMESVFDYNQMDVDTDFGFNHIMSVVFTEIYEYNSSSDNNPGDYTVIGGSEYEGGTPFNPTGSYLPTVQNVNVFNWVLGFGLAAIGFVYLKDTAVLKDLGLQKKRKY